MGEISGLGKSLDQKMTLYLLCPRTAVAVGISQGKIYKKWYGVDANFRLGDDGETQQRVTEIGTKDDPWHALPDGFLDTLLGDKSYTLD